MSHQLYLYASCKLYNKTLQKVAVLDVSVTVSLLQGGDVGPTPSPQPGIFSIPCA